LLRVRIVDLVQLGHWEKRGGGGKRVPLKRHLSLVLAQAEIEGGQVLHPREPRGELLESLRKRLKRVKASLRPESAGDEAELAFVRANVEDGGDAQRLQPGLVQLEIHLQRHFALAQAPQMRLLDVSRQLASSICEA